ncbi:hypothetical protein GCM10027449_03790 [Sinomonas notoginsengisoli]|uniref:hypothetical protein n=1 Tax=Sinomonas notoginsengisoli TaxID=1457311 RepID=UPI001F1EBEBA|nr:hypothetical protein [Sinomonas notoginsengisoli]
MSDTPETENRISDDVLAGYLHNHVVAANSGEHLIEEAAKAWTGTPYGPTMTRLTDEIKEDSEELQRIVETLGMKVPVHKQAISWVGEQASKLAPLNPSHGSAGHHPQLELESLISAVTGKSLLWETLQLLAEEDGRIDAAQMERLHVRAVEQIGALTGIMRATAKARFRNEAIKGP